MFDKTKYRRDYYWGNRDHIRMLRKKRYLKNRVSILAKRKDITQEKKEKIQKQRVAYRELHKEELKVKRKLKREKQPEHIACLAKKDYALMRRRTPWIFHLYAAKARCNSLKHIGYHRYGARGIECRLTKKEVEFLWFRDTAEYMKKPSLDRGVNTDHYTIETCSFMELVDNIKKVFNEKKKIKNNLSSS